MHTELFLQKRQFYIICLISYIIFFLENSSTFGKRL